jgi:hypothetical protein
MAVNLLRILCRKGCVEEVFVGAERGWGIEMSGVFGD